MNADDNLREFKQYYPDIPMSRELIFKCGCRHWREDITSRPMVCPDHCERVKYYLTTCPDCGRVVIRKNYSRVFDAALKQYALKLTGFKLPLNIF